MKVQSIKRRGALGGLENWGTAGLPGTPEMQITGRRTVIPGKEDIDTGIFRVTPGTYRRAVNEAEVMHFLTGRGSFTPDGADTIHFASGDTLFFEAKTEGTWQIDETMSKVYVIL